MYTIEFYDISIIIPRIAITVFTYVFVRDASVNYVIILDSTIALNVKSSCVKIVRLCITNFLDRTSILCYPSKNSTLLKVRQKLRG